MLSGGEDIFWAPLPGLIPLGEYDADKDLLLYRDPPLVSRVHLAAGRFAVFHPGDAHKPGCAALAPEEVRKIVSRCGSGHDGSCLPRRIADRFRARAQKDLRLRHVTAFERAAGGAPANVAAGFARLGGASSFVGKVGADEFGWFLRDALAQAGVETSHLYATEEAQTGLAFISLRADGERDFFFYRQPAADMLLRPAEVPEALLAQCRIFHFGSVSLIASPAREATLAAAAFAGRRGRLVSFDPNLRPPLWPSLAAARDQILAGLALANLLKVSGEELVFIAERQEHDAAIAWLFREYPDLRLIATTLGRDGCLLATRGGTVALPGFPIEAVDTTGAGDGFTAGLLYVLNAGLAAEGSAAEWEPGGGLLPAAGRFANAVGALVATKRGGIPAMPDRAAVEDFLLTQG